MRRRAFIFVMVVFFGLCAAGRADGAPTSAEIDNSIQQGIRFLLDAQNPDGSWGDRKLIMAGDVRGDDENKSVVRTDPTGGATALVTLALLSSGQSPQSEPLKKAIDFLKAKKMTETYSVALRACVYSLLPDAAHSRELAVDASWLRTALAPKAPFTGLYGYRARSIGAADLSNSQYAVLGVWYAAEAGIEVPSSYWTLVERAWQTNQTEDGGWAYWPKSAGGTAYMSMTVAGLATLYITQDYLHAHESHPVPNQLKNKSIERGLEWLAANYSTKLNRGAAEQWGSDREFIHYMMFGYERVGEASGLTRFGKHLWFPEGAEFLLGNQLRSGSWRDTLGEIIDTSYALLFLSRGRSPVAIQKLQFGSAVPSKASTKSDVGHWNNRPRDVGNIIRWLRRETERHINWQIVSADSTPAELRESPILYLASEGNVQLTESQIANIKRYIETGGLLLCVNEGTGATFPKSIEELAKKMFSDYAFHDLPATHLLFKENFPITNLTYPIRGLSNGARELILLVPQGDLSWQYESMGVGRGNPYQAFPIAANLYLYVTGKSNPKFKGETTWVERDDSEAKGKLSIARLRYGGNWNPEPAGWERLGNVIHNEDHVDLDVAPVALSDLATLQRYKLAHLTATGKFSLTKDEQDNLKKYLDGGGMVLFDAAGGSPDTARDFEDMVTQQYPNSKFEILPSDYSIFSRPVALKHFGYRKYGSADRTSTNLPRLRGLRVDGRLIAISSGDDLSVALTGAETDGVMGYSTATATDILRNWVLSSSK